MNIIRTYEELIKYKSFKERYNYLKLDGIIGEETFGFDRYLNQKFYNSIEWKQIRDQVIARDMGNDLALEEYPINGKIFIHHMNPINKNDIYNHSDNLLNINYMVCVSFETHNAIHYGYLSSLSEDPIIRTRNDTTLWQKE